MGWNPAGSVEAVGDVCDGGLREGTWPVEVQTVEGTALVERFRVVGVAVAAADAWTVEDTLGVLVRGFGAAVELLRSGAAGFTQVWNRFVGKYLTLLHSGGSL